VEDEIIRGASVPLVGAEAEAPPEVSDTGRLEAFSDGVFAVAITLLVLDLRVPTVESVGPGDLLAALGMQWPNYLAYVTSFATILVMWVNHHTLFKLIGRADRLLMIYNGLLLLLVCVVPFTTSLVAEYATSKGANGREAGAIYSGVFIFISIAFNLVWRYASKERRLLDGAAHQAHVDGVNRAFRFGPLAYVVALALALVFLPASLALNLALAIYYALPHGRRAPPSR
jgi:uncharacterized membrane protein